VIEWVKHTLSPFAGHDFDDNVRQAILYSAKTALGAGSLNFPEMASVRIEVGRTDDGKEFTVRVLNPGEKHGDGSLLIDMTEGVSAEELQTRINYVYTATVNACASMTANDRFEILRGAADCMKKYWPEEWKRIVADMG